MIVVTGGAGFVGSNIVAALNQRGERNILVVDELSDASKLNNLAGLALCDYMDKREFLRALRRKNFGERVTAVLHQGACANTLETDGQYMMENNFTYSKALYRFCKRREVQFIYASSAAVYGAGAAFTEAPENEAALNVYAFSKLLFDQYVRRQPQGEFQCVGLRYFNVYGAREGHKGAMASMAWHFFNQYQAGGTVKLFAGSDGYADGEQRRDFVSVEDVVAVNLFFLTNPDVSGLYNVGTGRSPSFNELAVAVINACRRHRGEPPTTLAQAQREKEITYIPMPDALRGKYQSYTQADSQWLRAAGYERKFLNVEEGVARYVEKLLG